VTPATATRSADQAGYYALDKRAGKLSARLAREDDPATRAALLDELAVCEQDMADLHMEAFGPDPIGHEGGRDLSESLASSARLIRLLAGAEHELAGTPALTKFFEDFADDWTVTQAAITEKLCDERDRDKRADLIDQLYDAVVDEVGGQAAEVLVSLALCEREAAHPRPLRWRAIGRWVWWATGTAINGLIALAVGAWVFRTGHSAPGMGFAAAVFAVAAFVAFQEIDAWLQDRWSR
jgi:hypothetical protein